MDRADRQGLGLAVGGHVLLLAALSLSFVAARRPVMPPEPVMDVQLTDAVGLRSATPEPATEAPAPSEAPELAPSEPATEAAPAPAPQPTPRPEPKAEPRPPEPSPKPTPVPAKPAPPEKAEAKPRLSADIVKGLKDPARREAKAGGSRLGPNFLKGIAGASAGKATTARAAVSGTAMNGLAAAIKRQVQPCYELGALGGTPAMKIVTVLRLRFNRDGSVAGTPQVVEQTGVDGANQGYARQMADVSRRAVLRCAPLRLPAELYEGGWELIDMGFIPGQLS